MQLTQLILAAIPAMEENDFIKEVLSKYAKDTLEEKKNTTKRKLENINGNVINVDFTKENP
jgi:uncharacterized protein (UPF0333 family)